MEIPIIKIQNMVIFPYEKFYLRNTEEISKVAFVGTFVGVVYSKNQNEIKEIGVICKIISVQSNLFYSLGRNSSSESKVLLQGVSRMKILNYKNAGENSIFQGKIEAIEDEISNFKLINISNQRD